MNALTSRRTFLKRAGAFLIASALIAGMLATMHHGSQRAMANELKGKATANLRTTRSWSAEVVERELVRDGVYRTVTHRIQVAGAGRYRVDCTERDATNRPVVSSTIVADGDHYTIVTDGTGQSRLHVVRNVPPGLGATVDTIIARQVDDLSRASSASIESIERIAGRRASKVRLDPGHVMWLDSESGMPLKEQFISDGTVTYESEVTRFDAVESLPDTVFDTRGIITSETVTEDLGFRASEDSAHASAALGFAPLSLTFESVWVRTASGYSDKREPGDSLFGGGDWVERYEGNGGCVLVTQSRATGSQHHQPMDVSAQADGFTALQIGDADATCWSDGLLSHVHLRTGTADVSLEATLGLEELIRLTRTLIEGSEGRS